MAQSVNKTQENVFSYSLAGGHSNIQNQTFQGNNIKGSQQVGVSQSMVKRSGHKERMDSFLSEKEKEKGNQQRTPMLNSTFNLNAPSKNISSHQVSQK